MALTKKQKLLLKALEKNLFIVKMACEMVRIPRITYYYWIKYNQEFRMKVGKLKEDLLTVVEDRLKIAALEGQPWAVKFFLSRRHPEYKSKMKIEEGVEFIFEDKENEV